MLAVGTAFNVEGYGQLRGQQENATIRRQEKNQVVLLLHDPETATDYEVPFRLVDGMTVGSSPEGGFRIPPAVLAQLKGEAPASPENGKTGGKSETSKTKTTPASTKTTPAASAGKGRIMNRASTKPTEAEVKTATGSGSKTKTPPAPAAAPATSNGKKKTTEAAPAPEVKAEETTKRRTASKPAPAASTPPAASTASKAKTKPAPEPEPEKPQTGRKTRTVAEKPEPVETVAWDDMSPMEQADVLAREGRTPGENETGIRLTPIMFEQIVWNHVRPFPNGRRVPGYKEFKEACKKAQKRSYVHMNVDEPAATYLVNSVFVGGWKGDWTGSLTGGFKRVAKRVSEELNEAFDIPVPAMIEEHVSGRQEADEEPEEKPQTGRKRNAKPEPEPEPAPTNRRKTGAASKPAETSKPAVNSNGRKAAPAGGSKPTTTSRRTGTAKR